MTAIINKKKYIYIYPVNKERESNSKTYSKRSGGRSRDKSERKEREREREEHKRERDRGVFVSRGAKQPAKFRRAPCPPLSKYEYRGELTSEAPPVVLYKGGGSRERGTEKEGGTPVNCGDPSLRVQKPNTFRAQNPRVRV